MGDHSEFSIDLSKDIVSFDHGVDESQESSSNSNNTLIGDSHSPDSKTTIQGKRNSVSQPNLPSVSASNTQTSAAMYSSQSTSQMEKRFEQGIPVLATLQENEDLKMKVHDLNLKIMYLRNQLPYIEGKNSEQICGEYAQLHRDKRSLEERISQLESSLATNVAEMSEMRNYKERQEAWASRMKDSYNSLTERANELEVQLLSARRRYPDFDDTVDSILGDAKDQRIADLEDKICDMEDEKKDVLRTKEALENNCESARHYAAQLEKQVADLQQFIAESGNVHGDKTFSVNVGNLQKVTYEEKIMELMVELDSRDEKIKQTEEELMKMFTLLSATTKRKDKLEKEMATMTMTMQQTGITGLDGSTLSKSTLEDPAKRERTMNDMMDQLCTLDSENQELQRKLIELGAAARQKLESERAQGGVDVLDSEEQVQRAQLEQMLQQLDNLKPVSRLSALELTKFSPNATHASGRSGIAADADASQLFNASVAEGLLEKSLIARNNVEELKEKIDGLRALCGGMFERLKNASTVFAHVLEHIRESDKDRELIDKITALQLTFNDSVSEFQTTTEALEGVDTSIRDVSAFIEKSLNESGFCMASFHHTRLANETFNKSLGTSPMRQMLNFDSPARSAPTQQVTPLQTREARVAWQEKEAAWNEEREHFEEENKRIREELTEAVHKLDTVRQDLLRTKEQQRVCESTLREQELACSEHKEELERLICEQQHWKNSADTAAYELKSAIELSDTLRLKAQEDQKTLLTFKELNEQLQEETAKHEQEASRNNELVQELRKELEEVNEEVSSKMSILVRTQEDLNAARVQLSEATDRETQLKNRGDEAIRCRDEMENRLSSLIQREDSLREELAAVHEKAHRLEKELDAAETNAKKYIDAMNRLEEEVNRSRDDVKNAHAQMDDVRKELAEVQKSSRQEMMDQLAHSQHSSQTELTGSVVAVERLDEVHQEVKRIADQIARLAKLRGDAEAVIGQGQGNALGHSEPVVAVLGDLCSVSRSIERACSWTNDQTTHIDALNKRLENALGERQIVATSVDKMESSPPLRSQNKENVAVVVEEAKPKQVEKKFRDPLRQDFFQMTNQANELVQSIKSMNGKNMNETYANVLALARALREVISERYHAISKDNKENVHLSTSDLLERLALLTDQNVSLTSKLYESRQKWKEAREALAKSSHCALDPVLAEEIEGELTKIKSVLDKCHNTYKSSKTRRQEAAAAAKNAATSANVE